MTPGFIKTRLMRFGYFIDPQKEVHAFDDPSIIKLLGSQTFNLDN
jgi:hypothetical protein